MIAKIHFNDRDVRRGVNPVPCGRDHVETTEEIDDVTCKDCLAFLLRGKQGKL